MTNNLNENLSSTWQVYTEYLKNSIRQKHISEAIAFTKTIKQAELAFTSCDYALYWALLYAYNDQPSNALKILKKAHHYGYRGFWQFDPDSHGWGSKDSEEYRLLEPIHQNSTLQQYIKSVYTGKVEPWGFDIYSTPFCWFEKVILGRKNVCCYLSKQKLQKGELVYGIRFFNGAYDIPSNLFYCQIEAFEQHQAAKTSLHKYLNNSYSLSDYAFKISYDHPLINFFWNNIEDFDLLTTLKLIAQPPVHPTPYLKYAYEERPLPIYDSKNKGYHLEKNINGGTGSEFLDLLYILVKCGYLEAIVSLLPQLPTHFPYLFLFFNSKNIHEKIANYLTEDSTELSNLLDISFKRYNKKSPQEVLQLALYGQNNPNFLKNFSICLNYYECHLYSNYHPGVNWFFQEFSHFIRTKGGGLLDFFISAPELIPALQQMKTETCYLTGLSQGAIDAYNNSLPFLYRTIVLHLAFIGAESTKKWMDFPIHFRDSNYYKNLKKVHKHTLKSIKIIAKN